MMAGAAAGGVGGNHYAIRIGTPATSPAMNQLDEDTIRRRMNLYQAVRRGDWKTLQRIYGKYPPEINEEITVRKETVLHVACMLENTKFVRELIRGMKKDDVAHKDIQGWTALTIAAVKGNREIAQIILDKNPELDMVRTEFGSLPVQEAIFAGQKNMVEFFCRRISHDNYLEEQDRRDLLVEMINFDMSDIAFKYLVPAKGENLLIEKDIKGDTALSAIARKPNIVSKSGLFTCINPGFRATRKKVRHLIRRVWYMLAITKEEEIIRVVGDGWRSIFVAAENGNVEFLRIAIYYYPHLATKLNNDGHSIFHVAIIHRQREIFKIIHEIGSLKKSLVTVIDINGNHMLYLAAELPLSHRQQSIAGEALQLQNELKWFKDVKKVAGPKMENLINTLMKEPLLPQQLFIKNHQDMIRKGEEYVKKTAKSYILVATLVATIVFAAAYTVAGGSNQATGYPLFLHEISFKIFAVADAVSLVCSMTSIVVFLSLLTDTTALDDFVRLIPAKLNVGFITLIVSLASMMITFVTAFFEYFQQHHVYIKYGVPLAVGSIFPVAVMFSFRR